MKKEVNLLTGINTSTSLSVWCKVKDNCKLVSQIYTHTFTHAHS